MMSGAGSYFQGEGAAKQCGTELRRRHLHRAFIIGGQRAWQAAGSALIPGLDEAGIVWEEESFHGFCTEDEVDLYAAQVRNAGSDCLIGVGGGKVLDLCKTIAARLKLPVFTVPTCAATCAAYAALSIMYNDAGCQDHTHYHSDEVSGVFADTAILAAAPARYLAAGMADAMAKACEYSSMRQSLHYGDVDISKYLGYELACACDHVLLACGSQAYLDNQAGHATPALEDAVFATIAATGIVSGMGGFAGRTGSRFAIAHGFNEVIRGRYVDTKEWLHGEIVAVGILAQLHANGASAAYQAQVLAFYRAIGVPTTLRDMGIVLDDNAFAAFQEELVQHSYVAPELADQVRAAISHVRGGKNG